MTPPEADMPPDPPRPTAVSPPAADGAVPTGAAPGFGPPAAAGEVGTLGPYRLVTELGRGGMGAVYAAVDTRLGRRVALKVLLPALAADRAARGRFVREARAAAQVVHEHVVAVYEADERDGVPYIAMPLLDGCSLAEYLRRVPAPPVAEAVRVGREAALGLAAAHAGGLVHRDVKPGNLWLEAPRGAVKVLDFGLARLAAAAGDLTADGAVLGTPGYMSPEQARGEPVDHRSDLFGLGAVLYHLCAGRPPFPGATAAAVLIALGGDGPPPVRSLNPAVPPALAALIHQLLARGAADRPASADEVARRLHEVARALPIADATTAPATTVVTTPPPTGRRRRRRVAVAAAALLAAVAAGAVALRDRPAADPPPDPPAGPVPPPSSGSVPRPADADPDRRAAEWVLARGGVVWVDRAGEETRHADALPDGRFAVVRVHLSGAPVTDADLPVLAGCGVLSHVNLARTAVTDGGLAALAAYPALHALDLDGTGVTDDGVPALAGLRRLRELHLNDTKVTNAGLARLAGCSGLSLLGVGGTGVTDDGLKHLAGLPELTHLGLGRTGVTDAGLAHVVARRGLAVLWLNDTGVTDDGLARLAGLANLYGLDVRRTRVTARGLAAFHEAVPGCRIEHDGGVTGPKN